MLTSSLFERINNSLKAEQQTSFVISHSFFCSVYNMNNWHGAELQPLHRNHLPLFSSNIWCALCINNTLTANWIDWILIGLWTQDNTSDRRAAPVSEAPSCYLSHMYHRVWRYDCCVPVEPLRFVVQVACGNDPPWFAPSAFVSIKTNPSHNILKEQVYINLLVKLSPVMKSCSVYLLIKTS